MKSRLALNVLLAALGIVGCGTANYRDASSDSKYEGLVGQTIKLQDEFMVQGVTLPGSAPHTVDQYDITPKPGFSNRYVPLRKPLPAGTELRILKVEECTNCFGFSDIQLLVAPPESQYADHKVFLLPDFGETPLLVEEGGRAVFRSPLVQVLPK